MDYDTDSKAVLSRARRYLEYADSQRKDGSVRVGLWLAGWNETHDAFNPGDMSRNESDIEAQMAALRPELAETKLRPRARIHASLARRGVSNTSWVAKLALTAPRVGPNRMRAAEHA